MIKYIAVVCSACYQTVPETGRVILMQLSVWFHK